MRNVILILAELIICCIAIIILNKKYKTDGLYVYGIINRHFIKSKGSKK